MKIVCKISKYIHDLIDNKFKNVSQNQSVLRFVAVLLLPNLLLPDIFNCEESSALDFLIHIYFQIRGQISNQTFSQDSAILLRWGIKWDKRIFDCRRMMIYGISGFYKLSDCSACTAPESLLKLFQNKKGQKNLRYPTKKQSFYLALLILKRL